MDGVASAGKGQMDRKEGRMVMGLSVEGRTLASVLGQQEARIVIGKIPKVGRSEQG